MNDGGGYDDDQRWLQSVLTGSIPLARAMALRVVQIDECGVALSLPLPPNINDKGTAFGGSLASALILAGWSLPRLLLHRAGIAANLVIGHCELRFLLPVDGDFEVRCHWPNAAVADGFVRKLEASDRAGMTLQPEAVFRGQVAATLSAKYAALRS